MSFRFSIFSIHSPVIPNLDPLPVTPPSALRIKKSNTANVVVLVISVYDRQWTKEPLNNYFQSVKTVIWLMIWVTSSLSFHPFFFVSVLLCPLTQKQKKWIIDEITFWEHEKWPKRETIFKAFNDTNKS